MLLSEEEEEEEEEEEREGASERGRVQSPGSTALPAIMADAVIVKEGWLHKRGEWRKHADGNEEW